MFQSWRLKLREAEEALRAGRLDDARLVLADSGLRQYLPGQRLTEKLIQGFVDRALRKGLEGDPLAGWGDLEAVRPLAGDCDAFLAAREELFAHFLTEIESRLAADDAAGALAQLERLERRQITAKALKILRDVARRLESARHLSRRGKFAEADEQLQSVAALRPDLPFVAGRRSLAREKLEASRKLIEDLHRAMAKPDWSRAVTLADELLEIAPEHTIAQEARRRAWAEVKARCEPSRTHLTAYNRDAAEPSQHRLSPIGFPQRPASSPAETPRPEAIRLEARLETKPANGAVHRQERTLSGDPLGPKLVEPLVLGDAGWQVGSPALGSPAVGSPAIGRTADVDFDRKIPDSEISDSTSLPEDSTANSPAANNSPTIDPRLLLWVDGVGGYLVCLGNDVMIGQAVPATPIEIPILGDLSRRHAWIRRQSERYLIEPCRVADSTSGRSPIGYLADPVGSAGRAAFAAVRINDQAITKPTLLYDGDEIELGSGVKLRFVQPHALSATARLDFLSRHRPQLRVDGVLLMAESCVLGPNFRNHVVCRDWKDDVVLYRHSDRLYCRAMDDIEIDGRLCEGRGEVTAQSVVKGDDFSLALEAVRVL